MALVPFPVFQKYANSVSSMTLNYSVMDALGIYSPNFHVGDLQQVFSQLRDVVIRSGSMQSKVLRPWDIDPEYTSTLDRSQTWLGFEFELSFTSDEARSASVGYVWDTFDYVCFDAEGAGCASEITFSPVELSRFEDGTADALVGIKELMRTGALSRQDEYNGTHVNISIPECRSISGVNMLSSCFNASIRDMTPSQKLLLFGRDRPYGGAFGREPATPSYRSTGSWIEFKLFRSPRTPEQLDNYVLVSKRLASTMQALTGFCDANLSPEERADLGLALYSYDRYVDDEVNPCAVVSNLYDVLSTGAEPVITKSVLSTQDFHPHEINPRLDDEYDDDDDE